MASSDFKFQLCVSPEGKCSTNSTDGTWSHHDLSHTYWNVDGDSRATVCLGTSFPVSMSLLLLRTATRWTTLFRGKLLILDSHPRLEWVWQVFCVTGVDTPLSLPLHAGGRDVEELGPPPKDVHVAASGSCTRFVDLRSLLASREWREKRCDHRQFHVAWLLSAADPRWPLMADKVVDGAGDWRLAVHCFLTHRVHHGHADDFCHCCGLPISVQRQGAWFCFYCHPSNSTAWRHACC